MALRRPQPRQSKKGGAILPPAPQGNKRGRKPGVPNKHTRLFKEACLLAAECMGLPEVVRDEEGRITELIPTGDDGFFGYMLGMARYDYKEFNKFLLALVPQQKTVRIEDDVREMNYQTPEQIREELLRQGIPEVFLPKLIPSPKDVAS
jgi:hypothetical protein